MPDPSHCGTSAWTQPTRRARRGLLCLDTQAQMGAEHVCRRQRHQNQTDGRRQHQLCPWGGSPNDPRWAWVSLVWRIVNVSGSSALAIGARDCGNALAMLMAGRPFFLRENKTCPFHCDPLTMLRSLDGYAARSQKCAGSGCGHRVVRLERPPIMKGETIRPPGVI
jgi:hypothetical protein